MNSSYFVGCITGTSVDGLDLALLAFSDSELAIKQATTVALPPKLRERLLALGQVDQVSVEEIAWCDSLLGDFIGTSIVQALREWEIEPTSVKAIGSHGQTIRHRPDGKPDQPSFTLQIGDASRIVEHTGITTVADFRRRDIAAGGQGAPLVPPFHHALLRDLGSSAVIANIGGISNVSIFKPAVSGFDTGPGNGLMDAWCSQNLNNAYDDNGQWAASGRVNQDLLTKLLADPYFARPAPKSTGREHFNLQWLNNFLSEDLVPEDVQATLCELTATTLIQALRAANISPTQLIIVGGGRLNGNLMQRLTRLANYPVLVSEEVGIEGDGLEAAAFAWFAAQTINGRPSNEPAVTGASGYRVLGAIYPC